MKQTSKKARNVKATDAKATDSAKSNATVKVDASLLQKANQFHRFLEASCDCV